MVMKADKKSSLVQIAQATLDEANQATKVAFTVNGDALSDANPMPVKIESQAIQVNVSLDKTEDSVTAWQGGGAWAVSNPNITEAVATAANQTATNSKLDTLITQTDGIEGSLSSLDTKVATATNQTAGNSSLSSIDGKLPASLGQKAKTGSLSVVLASDQDTVNVAGSVAVTDFPRLNAVNLFRRDYVTAPVNTSSYAQLIASIPAAVKEIEIFDSSGETLVLAIGEAGSEVNKVYVFPGGNGRIPLQIAATARLSVKAVSNNATSGELIINFYG